MKGRGFQKLKDKKPYKRVENKPKASGRSVYKPADVQPEGDKETKAVNTEPEVPKSKQEIKLSKKIATVGGSKFYVDGSTGLIEEGERPGPNTTVVTDEVVAAAAAAQQDNTVKEEQQNNEKQPPVDNDAQTVGEKVVPKQDEKPKDENRDENQENNKVEKIDMDQKIQRIDVDQRVENKSSLVKTAGSNKTPRPQSARRVSFEQSPPTKSTGKVSKPSEAPKQPNKPKQAGSKQVKTIKATKPGVKQQVVERRVSFKNKPKPLKKKPLTELKLTRTFSEPAKASKQDTTSRRSSVPMSKVRHQSVTSSTEDGQCVTTIERVFDRNNEEVTETIKIKNGRIVDIRTVSKAVGRRNTLNNSTPKSKK